MTASPREIALAAGGLRFHALEWPGPGPLVVLAHATSFCADVWQPVWAAARAAGAPRLRAVAVDVRGHGRTDAPQDAAAYAWSKLAGDVIALVENLGGSGAERAVVVGHSSGGTAALVAAALRPDRIRAVAAVEPVLYDPPAMGADADSFAGSRSMAERALRRRSVFPDRASARETLARRFPYSGFAPESLDAYLDGGLAPCQDGVALRCAPHVEAWTYAGASALDPWEDLRALAAPALLVRAEHGAVPDALVERLRARAPRLVVARVAGTTHFAPLERPAAVGAALGAFLRDVERPAREPARA